MCALFFFGLYNRCWGSEKPTPKLFVKKNWTWVTFSSKIESLQLNRQKGFNSCSIMIILNFFRNRRIDYQWCCGFEVLLLYSVLLKRKPHKKLSHSARLLSVNALRARLLRIQKALTWCQVTVCIENWTWVPGCFIDKYKFSHRQIYHCLLVPKSVI